jgi:hypothetical protein
LASAPTAVTPGTTPESGQVTLQGGCLQFLKHNENVLSLGSSYKSIIHFTIANFRVDSRLTGFFQWCITGNFSGPVIIGGREMVSLEEPTQCRYMSSFSLANIDEGSDWTEILDHLIVGWVGFVLVIQRFKQNLDFFATELCHCV